MFYQSHNLSLLRFVISKNIVKIVRCCYCNQLANQAFVAAITRFGLPIKPAEVCSELDPEPDLQAELVVGR